MNVFKTTAVAAFSGLVLAGWSVTAWAQAPDISAGRKRAEVCMACHGDNGRSVAPGIPHLAGQDNDYLVKALQAYRGGQERQDPTMVEMAKPLSDADIANIALFFSRMTND